MRSVQVSVTVNKPAVSPSGSPCGGGVRWNYGKGREGSNRSLRAYGKQNVAGSGGKQAAGRLPCSRRAVNAQMRSRACARAAFTA